MSGAIDVTDITVSNKRTSPEKYYWNLPTPECAFELWGRIEEYYNEMRRTGRLALYRNSFSNFYAGWIYRASMYKGGEMGELTRSFWNHERNILLHLLVQTTQNKLSYKPQVQNSDSAAVTKREFAEGLLQHYATDYNYDLDTKSRQAVEDCLVFGEASLVAYWNRFKGEPVIPDQEGNVKKQGDIEYWNVTPMDCIINTSHQERSLVQWRIIRRWRNKYDVAAEYPTFNDSIIDLTDLESSYGTKIVTLIHHDDSTIPVFYCFHDKTPAVPKGRLLVMCGPEVVLEDGPLDDKYESIPAHDMIVATMAGSPYGYSVAFDLIPLQQGLNELVSAVMTNNINFATQCVIGPKGGNLHYQSLATGMTYIEYDPKFGPNSKPEALNLTHSAPETYQLMDKLIQNMEIIGGINSLQRGQPDSNITSGQYAALVTTQSVIFNSGLQKAYTRMCEQVGTTTIKVLRKNMIGSKIAQIVGSSAESYLQEFTADDLEGIQGISVEITNPMLQTPAGKMQLADSLMKTGLIKDPQEYLGVYTDGDLPQLYHRQESQIKLIKKENEHLAKGEPVPPCAITDNHVMHILEHTPVIDNLETRMNPTVFKNWMEHQQSHIDQLVGKPGVHGPINPVLAGIIGLPTVPPGVPNSMDLPPAGPPPAPAAPGAGPVQTKPTQLKGNPAAPPGPAVPLPNTGMGGPQPTPAGQVA